MCAQSLSQVQLFVIPWTTEQAPLSTGFSWQEYWRRLPFPTPEASSRPRDRIHISCVSCIGRWVLYHCTSWISMGEILCQPLCFFFSPPHPSIGNNLSETALENLCNIIRDSSQACWSFLVMSVFVQQIIFSYDTGYVPEPWETVFRWAVGVSGSQSSGSSAQNSQGQPTWSSIPKTLRMLPSPPPICPTHRNLAKILYMLRKHQGQNNKQWF